MPYCMEPSVIRELFYTSYSVLSVSSPGETSTHYRKVAGEVSSNSPGSRVSTHVYIHCKNVVVLTIYLVVT